MSNGPASLRLSPRVKRLWSLLRWILLGIVLILSIGFIYQRREDDLYRSSHQAPGVLVDMGGYRLHLNCTGEGSHTVVLIGGDGDPSVIWEPVQADLQQSARVCSYDRPGIGWSDFRSGPALTVEGQVAILHELLRKAGENGPFVVTGHSVGGLMARMFAAFYPKDVAGVIEVDSSVGAQFAVLPSALGQANQSAGLLLGVCKAVQPFGLTRLLGLGKARAESLPSLSLGARAEIAYDFDRTGGCAGLAGDNSMAAEPLADGTAPISLGNLPLIVITGSVIDPESTAPPSTLLVQAQATWLGLQANLLQLSTRSTWVKATHSGHYVHLSEPGLVIQAVRDVLTSL